MNLLMTLALITVINVSSVEWFSHVTLATNPPIHHFIFEKMLQSASIHLEQHFCELRVQRKRSQTVWVLLHASAIQERGSTCLGEI